MFMEGGMVILLDVPAVWTRVGILHGCSAVQCTYCTKVNGANYNNNYDNNITLKRPDS